MTKSEFVTFALAGKARIEPVQTITRYLITTYPRSSPETSEEFGAIFLSIKDDDGSVYGEAAYFYDGDFKGAIDRSEAEALCKLIEREMARR
jgi:hypothetical protein